MGGPTVIAEGAPMEFRLAGVVECIRCHNEVELYQQKEDDLEWDPVSHGECCHLLYADWWDGTFVFGLSPSERQQS